MLGRLTWDAIPFNEPIALVAGGGAGLGVLAVLAIITKMRWWPYLYREWFTSVDHKRIGVMYTFLSADHAAARVCRRDHDALAAGDRRRRRPGLSAARPLRPDLFRARRDHDLLCGDAVRRRPDELRRAVAARRARRRLSRAQLGQLLADCIGRAADQPVAGHRELLARPAGSPTRRSPSSPFRPMSGSIITCGRCRSRESGRCSPASTW